MRTNTSSLIIFFCCIGLSSIVSAQTYFNTTLNSVMIQSDSLSKSVLISNLFDKRGDKSQLLGTGVMHSTDSIFQCRSLLAFDYGKIPSHFKPEYIQLAQLILYPLQIENEVIPDKGKYINKIVISRIAKPWEDSLTTWKNQPVTDGNAAAVKRIPFSKKDDVVKVDVTKQVIKMFKEGNYGFMVSSTDSPNDENSIMNWFASAKHENKDIRPILLIDFSSSVRTDLNLIDSAFKAQHLLRVPFANDAYNRAINRSQESFKRVQTDKIKKPVADDAGQPVKVPVKN